VTMPARVFGVLSLPFFFFGLFCALGSWRSAPWHPAVILLVLCTLMGFPDPASTYYARVKSVITDWRGVEDDVGRTFRWIEQNTPPSAVLLLPPWRKDSYYLARRPQFVCYQYVPYQNAGEWLSRLCKVFGWQAIPRSGIAIADLESRYNACPRAVIDEIVSAHGITHVVSAGQYDLPVLFESGQYRVYGTKP